MNYTDNNFKFVIAEDLQEGDIISDIPTNFREFNSLKRNRVTYIRKKHSIILGLYNLDKNITYSKNTIPTKLYIKFL